MSYAKYPVKQLKTILRKKLNELKPRPKTNPISQLKKKEILFILNQYKISYFPPIEKNTVLKRNVIKSYNDDEQE